MITIDYKSTGTLLNELATATLKYKYIGPKPEFKQRIVDLTKALNSRRAIRDKYHDARNLFLHLQLILEELWWAVEETIKLRHADPDDAIAIKNAGFAALRAFELNKQRTDTIREMDAIFGEAHITFLEKSFE